MIQILPYDLTEMRWHCAGNTSVVMFAEEQSLRVLAVHLAKSWRKYHLSDIAGKCTYQSFGHQLHHTNIHGKATLAVAFYSSMKIFTTPYMGVSCIVDSIAGKTCLVSEQNVTNNMGVRINPMAQFQLATHVRRFKMQDR